VFGFGIGSLFKDEILHVHRIGMRDGLRLRAGYSTQKSARSAAMLMVVP